MLRYSTAAFCVAAAAVFVTGDIQSQLDATPSGIDTMQTASVETNVKNAAISPPGHHAIRADRRGHFSADFKINGRHVLGIVDTGATFVTMNERIARKLGVSRYDLNYRFVVNTANGKTEAAHIDLDRVDIGNIKVRNVDAFVLKDRSLNDTILVGMSFMRKLDAYEVKDETLYLKR